MGGGQGTGFNSVNSNRRIGSQQNRQNTGSFDSGFGMGLSTGYPSGGRAMPRGRGGRIGRGTKRGGTGDQSESSLLSRVGAMPGRTTIQTPDFMKELNQTFSNSPFQQPGGAMPSYVGMPDGRIVNMGMGTGSGDTMQVQRSGGGRGGIIPTRQEALQDRLNAGAIRNAEMQSGQGMFMRGPYGSSAGVGAVDPYMVEQALGEGNLRDAMTAEEVGMNPGQRMGMGYGNPMGYGGSNLAVANQNDFNFDGGVGLDDMAMALTAQSAGREFDGTNPYGQRYSDDEVSELMAERQRIQDQYGAQEMQERNQRMLERGIEMERENYQPRPREVRELSPVMGEGYKVMGGTKSFPGPPNSAGRLQARSQRGAGRGRRRFGHGGIIDAYGRRLV